MAENDKVRKGGNVARYEQADELAQKIKAALGIEARTRRLILDLEVGMIPVLWLEALGTPIGDAPGELSSLDWGSLAPIVDIRDLSDLAASADLGRVEVKKGDLVLISWPDRLSENAIERLEARFGDLLEEWGADDIRVAIVEGADRFGILTICRGL